MRTCPKCGTQFGDELSYCLEDGSPLAEAAPAIPAGDQPTAQYGEKTVDLPGEAPPPTQASESPETAEQQTDTRYQPPEHSGAGVSPVFSPPGVQKKGSRSRYLLPLTLVSLTGFFLIGAVGIGLFVYMSTASRDVAMANTNTAYPTISSDQNANVTADSSNASSPLVALNPSETNTVSSANTESKPSPTSRNQAPTPAPTRVIDNRQPPTVLATPPVAVRPTPRPDLPKTISGGVLNGRAISLPKPPYPPAARAARASGSVSVQVLIDESGRVISASAVSGHPLLRGAAESAARGARFSSTMLSGQPVKVSGIITYNFVP
jgi:TonB family protein